MNASPDQRTPQAAGDRPCLMGYADIFHAYRLTRRFVQKLVREKQFPPAVQIGSGKLALWRADDLEQWLKDWPARVLHQ